MSSKHKIKIVIQIILMVGMGEVCLSQNNLIVNKTRSSTSCGNCGDVVLIGSESSINSTNNISLPLLNITLDLEYEVEGCSGGGSGGVQRVLDTRIDNTFQSIQYTGNGGTNACNSVNFGAIVIVDITEPQDNSRCEEEKFFTDSPQSVSGLNWQYYSSNNEWTDIPIPTNQYPLNKSVKEILGTNYASLFSGSLQLRYQITRTNVTAISNTVIFSIFSGSPGFDDIQPKDTYCSYTSDGGFTVYFDRDLNSGEELVISVYEQDGQNLGPLVDSTNPGEATILGVNNSFVWPRPLPAGDYIMRYQSLGGCLEDDQEFTINSPDPVTFVVQPPTHVSCNGNTDGSVTLSAGGGVGGYRYILNNGTAIPFTDTSKDASHVVNNLGPTSHTFKVVDGNKCVAKNQ